MEFPFDIRFLQVKRTGMKKLSESEAAEYQRVVTSIYCDPSRFEQFIALYNKYHKVKYMNHTLYYFMKWRLFDVPPDKKSVDLNSLYIDNYTEVLFDSSKKYYDNISGIANNYFSNNSSIKADEINLTKIDPVLAYEIPGNLLGKLDKDLHEQVIEFSKENPDAKKQLQKQLTEKKYLVRDGWKRTCLAKIQGKKKINAYCFNYFNRGNKGDVYVVHEDLYAKARKIAS